MVKEREVHLVLSDDRLTPELEAFLEGRRTLPEIEKSLEGRVTFERPGQIGVVRFHASLPSVAFRSEHLLGALGRALAGVWSQAEVTQWAAAVLLLDCFDLEHPGPGQDALAATVWDLASAGANDQLTPTRLRELIDQALDAAA